MSKYNSSDRAQFYIGVDGGGTSCRARTEDAEGCLLGQGVGGRAATAAAKDYASLTPIVLSYAEAGDPFAKEIVAEGAWHAGVLIHSPVDFGAPRISLLEGLASRLVRWLSPDVLHFLSPPEDDAVAGACFWPVVTDEPRRQSKGTQIC
jgi:glucosamine kinase